MTAERFRQIQKQTDMTFTALSFYMGVTTAMVRNYARGDNTIPEYVAKMMQDLEDEL